MVADKYGFLTNFLAEFCARFSSGLGDVEFGHSVENPWSSHYIFTSYE
jgi:hypothetical protein